MRPATVRSICVMFAILAVGTVSGASAQAPPQTPRERCARLIAYFDRFGASRSENSDGVRNHTRLSAVIDCERGRYDEGIKEIQDLLRRKKFTVPPPPS